VFDGADFEKYLHDRIKVDGKAGQLGDSVKVTRDSAFSPHISGISISSSPLAIKAR